MLALSIKEKNYWKRKNLNLEKLFDFFFIIKKIINLKFNF